MEPCELNKSTSIRHTTGVCRRDGSRAPTATVAAAPVNLNKQTLLSSSRPLILCPICAMPGVKEVPSSSAEHSNGWTATGAGSSFSSSGQSNGLPQPEANPVWDCIVVGRPNGQRASARARGHRRRRQICVPHAPRSWARIKASIHRRLWEAAQQGLPLPETTNARPSSRRRPRGPQRGPHPGARPPPGARVRLGGEAERGQPGPGTGAPGERGRMVCQGQQPEGSAGP